MILFNYPIEDMSFVSGHIVSLNIPHLIPKKVFIRKISFVEYCCFFDNKIEYYTDCLDHHDYITGERIRSNRTKICYSHWYYSQILSITYCSEISDFNSTPIPDYI